MKTIDYFSVKVLGDGFSVSFFMHDTPTAANINEIITCMVLDARTTAIIGGLLSSEDDRPLAGGYGTYRRTFQGPDGTIIVTVTRNKVWVLNETK